MISAQQLDPDLVRTSIETGIFHNANLSQLPEWLRRHGRDPDVLRLLRHAVARDLGQYCTTLYEQGADQGDLRELTDAVLAPYDDPLAEHRELTWFEEYILERER